MAYQKSVAVCIGTSDYSESSQIVTFFTRDFGILRLIFKGALRKWRAFKSPVTLLSLYEIVFSPHRRGLHILADAALLESFQPLASELEKYYCALAMLDVIRTQKEEDADAGLFDLFLSSLRCVSKARYTYSLAFLFILKALSHLGFEPSFDSCAKCGIRLVPATWRVAYSRSPARQKAAQTRTVGGASLSLREGGLLCKKCADEVKPDFYISQAAVGVLRTLRLLAPERSGLVSLPDKLRREVAGFLQKFLEFTFEREFKTVKYLSKV
jgi:DNA repair protein RecO (recombination protein O)